MNLLIRVFGVPHELLHALALVLIGRRAVRIGRAHIDIPPDLTTRQYVFVAGLPALVFVTALALGVVGLVNAHTVGQAVMSGIVILIAGLNAAGTMGDIQLILLRLARER